MLHNMKLEPKLHHNFLLKLSALQFLHLLLAFVLLLPLLQLCTGSNGQHTMSTCGLELRRGHITTFRPSVPMLSPTCGKRIMPPPLPIVSMVCVGGGGPPQTNDNANTWGGIGLVVGGGLNIIVLTC